MEELRKDLHGCSCVEEREADCRSIHQFGCCFIPPLWTLLKCSAKKPANCTSLVSSIQLLQKQLIQGEYGVQHNNDNVSMLQLCIGQNVCHQSYSVDTYQQSSVSVVSKHRSHSKVKSSILIFEAPNQAIHVLHVIQEFHPFRTFQTFEYFS